MTARGLFITGTDTGVGKTVFTMALVRTLLAAGRTVAPYKPVCSGVEYWLPNGECIPPQATPSNTGTPVWSDVEQLYSATGGQWPRERISPQTFQAPLSPPTAAELEGRRVDESLLLSGYQWLSERAELVLVEGAGGFCSPISANWLNADLAKQLALPVVIVAPNRLGTINHTLLTIEAVRCRGLSVAGVVLNQCEAVCDSSTDTNSAEISRRGAVRIWGEIRFNSGPELQCERLPESMVEEFRNLIS